MNNNIKTLFRFRPINKYTFLEILNRNVFFSLPSRFNDPFEFQFNLSDIDIQAETLAAAFIEEKNIQVHKDDFVSIKNNMRVKLAALLENKINLLDNKGICCFSSKVNNSLMWSHYADGHRGICIEYEMHHFGNKVHKVKYSEQPPVLKIKDGEIDGQSLILDLVSTKRKEWEYENEYRVIHGHGERNFYLGRDSIKSVYFGYKTSKDDADAVARAVLASNASARWYKMLPNGPHSWDLTSIESDFHPE